MNAAKSECSSVESLADFWRSPCILPAAEKTRSTPADDAGAEKYCFTIFALHHFVVCRDGTQLVSNCQLLTSYLAAKTLNQLPNRHPKLNLLASLETPS